VTILSTTELVQQAWHALEDAVMPMLEAAGGLNPMHIVISPEQMELVQGHALEGTHMTHTGEMDAAVAETVRERVAALRAYAVLTISDTWYSGMLQGDLLKTVEAIGSAEAERRGLIKRREAILCQVDSPYEHSLLVQYYQRVKAYKKRGRKRIVWQEREEWPPEMLGEARGSRISNYFRDLPTAHA
jgi:hypothetical protein